MGVRLPRQHCLRQFCALIVSSHAARRAIKNGPQVLRTVFDGAPGENRTHNDPLGGGCYIHLTTEANFLWIKYNTMIGVFATVPEDYAVNKKQPLKKSCFRWILANYATVAFAIGCRSNEGFFPKRDEPDTEFGYTLSRHTFSVISHLTALIVARYDFPR